MENQDKVNSMNSHIEREFIKAVHSQKSVDGLTHGFYRYPARFSPQFARATMKLFTNAGDLVIDPFVGGGTTLVEACVLGRASIGLDISSLATFLTRVKTTPLSNQDFEAIWDWAENIDDRLNLRRTIQRPEKWINLGYQRNINSKKTWPIRKTLELAIDYISELVDQKQQDFVRCALLATGQWALDCQTETPSASKFRSKLLITLKHMETGLKEYTDLVENVNESQNLKFSTQPIILNNSAVNIDKIKRIKNNHGPKLILTSPPYPGVHVLYHRWQIHGRRETPAPFWIANSLDGQGESYYTLGHRQQKGLKRYFRKAGAVFNSLAGISCKDTLVVQMVGFSDKSWQLPRYLTIMKDSGFTEIQFSNLSNSSDGRLWRIIPNRKWYAKQQGDTDSSQEVVLFHSLE